jgi:hypothetical protein
MQREKQFQTIKQLSKMETLLKLTKVSKDKEGRLMEKPILIGVESIINVQEGYLGTIIESRAAMVTSCTVKESVEEIYQMYKSNQ